MWVLLLRRRRGGLRLFIEGWEGRFLLGLLFADNSHGWGSSHVGFFVYGFGGVC